MKLKLRTIIIGVFVVLNTFLWSGSNQGITINQGSEPAWVRSFPANSAFYIGIGNGRTQSEAQNAAINNIITQIKVKIESEMVDVIQESNGISREDSLSTIKINLKASIDDLEQVDYWFSPEKGYWAYYRLNIAQYQRSLAEKQRRAVEIALDFLRKSDSEQDPALSIKYAVLAFINISGYMTNAIKVNYQGREVLLTNEIIAKIQRLLSTVSITTSRESYSMRRVGSEPISAPFTFALSGRGIVNLPVRFAAKSGDAEFTSEAITGANGNVVCNIRRLKGNYPRVIISAQPDLYKMTELDIEDQELSEIYRNLLSRFGVPTKDIYIDAVSSTVGFRTLCLNDIANDPVLKSRAEVLANNLKSVLSTGSGFSFVESGPSDYEIVYKIDGQINLSGDVFFTRLLVSISIVEKSTGREVFTYTMDSPLRGGGAVNDKPRSVQNAVRKLTEEYGAIIESSVVRFLSGE